MSVVWWSSIRCSSAVAARRPRQTFLECVLDTHKERVSRLEEQIMEAEKKRMETLEKHKHPLLPVLPELEKRILNGQKGRLIPVGSTVTGLASNCSDLDLAFFPTDPKERTKFIQIFHSNQDLKQRMLFVMRQLLSSSLSEMSFEVEECLQLSRLKVPLVICKLKNGFSIDIQFPEENFHALRNTNLIRYYIKADSRVSSLYLWLRALCDSLEIKNSKAGLLSSYHLLMFVVHFLQSEQCLTPFPVLPVLCLTHPNLVSLTVPIDSLIAQLNSPIDKLKWKSRNKMSTAELAIRFIEYYSTFSPETLSIYIDRGLTQKRKNVNEHRLMLYDPYSNMTIIRSSYAKDAFMDAIKFVKRKMKNGSLLDSFPEFPESRFFFDETQFAEWRMQMKRNAALKEHLWR